jgi:hypothetical protein
MYFLKALVILKVLQLLHFLRAIIIIKFASDCRNIELIQRYIFKEDSSLKVLDELMEFRISKTKIGSVSKLTVYQI